MNQEKIEILRKTSSFRTDSPAEHIVLEEGWVDLNKGWFCRFTRDGKTIEAFGSSRRQAMRRARKFYRKITEVPYPYPREVL